MVVLVVSGAVVLALSRRRIGWRGWSREEKFRTNGVCERVAGEMAALSGMEHPVVKMGSVSRQHC